MAFIMVRGDALLQRGAHRTQHFWQWHLLWSGGTWCCKGGHTAPAILAPHLFLGARGWVRLEAKKITAPAILAPAHRVDNSTRGVESVKSRDPHFEKAALLASRVDNSTRGLNALKMCFFNFEKAF